METKTSPFYELCDRLYAAAAAGTAVLSEDYRLQRAVEAFAPMAQQNKVFAKLHKMCADLFTAENAASDLLDCIALAEALAVTQGTLPDVPETVTPPDAEQFKPHDIPYSRLCSLKESIAKAKNNKYLPDSLSEWGNDPRLVTAFLKVCDSNSENIWNLADVFKNLCGRSLVEPLFDSIDMTNPKSIGKQLSYIADISGNAHTDRFKQIASDENAPAAVRVNAVCALGRFEECAGDLIEIYRASKGKVNTAALEEIGRLSPPEGEPIFAKLAGKYKSGYFDAFSLARYPVCTQYVRETMQKCISEEPDKSLNWTLTSILRHKNDVYDCLDLILTQAEKHNDRYEGHLVEKVLLEDILYDEKYAEDYARITEQLFENHKQFMMLPRLILEIKRSGDKAYEILFDDLVKNIRTVREFVRDLDSVYGEKYIVLKCYSEIPDYPIMDHIPDGLLNVLTAAEPIESNDPENICQMIRHLYAIFKSEEEEKKALDAALKYALICDQHYPNIVAVHNMLTCGVLPRGAVCRCIYHTLEKKGGIPTTLYTMPMAKDEFAKQVYDEFCEALQTLPTMKDRLSEEVINKGQAVLRGMIKLTQENFQRMKISY